MLDHAQQFDQALRHYWHPVAVSEEVTAEPMQVRLLGETIVLYRDAEGLVALRDKCVHRGVALSGGCIRDGRLMCPYHGWQYDRTGKVAFIPALGAGGAIPSQARVHRYHVREDHGAVWIAPDEPVADLPPWPDDDWNSDDWHVFLVGTWRWQSSAGRMLENAIDFAHFNFVHEGFTELADGAFIKPFEIEITGDGMRYAYDDSVLLRDYTLHLPFTLHDRKSVVAVSGGVTWSEQGESKAGDITTITFIASPTDRAETPHLLVAVAQPLLRHLRRRLRRRVPRRDGAGPHRGRGPRPGRTAPRPPRGAPPQTGRLRIDRLPEAPAGPRGPRCRLRVTA